jgi:spore coat protein U-like protein
MVMRLASQKSYHSGPPVYLPYTSAIACTVSASGVIFGSYDPLGNTQITARGDIEITCAESTSYAISLSGGMGGFTPRQMDNGQGGVLNYNLFTDPTYQMVWGDGTAGTHTVGGSASDPGTLHSVYGLIPGGQNVPAGLYTDTIVVSVSY